MGCRYDVAARKMKTKKKTSNKNKIELGHTWSREICGPQRQRERKIKGQLMTSGCKRAAV